MIKENRTERDSNESLMRRFSRTVMSTGLVKKKKSKLFFNRKPNRRKVRESAIRRRTRSEQREYDLKTGRLKEQPRFGRGRTKS